MERYSETIMSRVSLGMKEVIQELAEADDRTEAYILRKIVNNYLLTQGYLKERLNKTRG